MGAQMYLGSDNPVLLLEEVDHLIQEIHCEPSSIEVKFSSTQALQMVRDAIDSTAELVIVTSHWSCNDRGSRLPFK
jgi:hypothetical protein